MIQAIAALPSWRIDPNWCLVVVGSISAGVVGWQSWETRQAAQAARDNVDATLKSVSLAQVQYKQWIEIRDWINVLPRLTELQSLMSPPEGLSITIGFNLVNTTDFPLTLKRS